VNIAEENVLERGTMPVCLNLLALSCIERRLMTRVGKGDCSDQSAVERIVECIPYAGVRPGCIGRQYSTVMKTSGNC